MTSTTIRIFIGSVQREFAQEPRALRDYVHDDVLVRRFFDVFLFEDAPATDRRPDRPRSPAQRYGVTAKGQAEIASISGTGPSPQHE